MAAKSFAGCWFKNALDWSGLFDIGAAKDDQYGLLDIGAPSYDQCGPFDALNDNTTRPQPLGQGLDQHLTLGQALVAPWWDSALVKR